MLGSITRACARQGYDLLVSFQQFSDDWHADYQDSHKADGLILLGYGDYLVSRDRLQKLVEQGTHFVRWGAVVEGQPGISVGCDNVHGGRIVTEHLLHLGVGASPSSATPPSTARVPRPLAGPCRRPARRRPHARSRAAGGRGGFDRTGGLRRAGQVLRARRDFDAVFAASDLLAIGAMRALDDAGLRVPSQVTVAGFDDIPMARFATPPLTTVLQNTKLAGDVGAAPAAAAARRNRGQRDAAGGAGHPPLVRRASAT